MQRVGWMEKGERPNEPGKSAAAHTHADRRTTMNDTKCGQIGKDARILFRTTEKYKTRRADEHRKSRSYCRTERLNCTKPVLGSQLSHKLRVRNAVPAQQGAPDGTHPPCGVRTFPPYRRLKCISDGKGKRGRKGWKTVGCPSLAFRSPSKGNLVESENAPVGRFPTRLWPTCSAKP